MEATFDWQDPLLLDGQLADDSQTVQDTAHRYCQDKLIPRVQQSFPDNVFDRDIKLEAGELGLLGATIEGFGCPDLNYACYGLTAGDIPGPAQTGIQAFSA